MAAAHVADASRRPHNTARPYSTGAPLILSGVKVVREGRLEPFLHAYPTLSSAAVRWAGLAVEDYSIPACVIPGHEHVESLLHVVLRGSVKYEVLTRGKALQFGAKSWHDLHPASGYDRRAEMGRADAPHRRGDPSEPVGQRDG